MTREKIKKSARESLSGNLGIMVLALFIIGLINSIASFPFAPRLNQAGKILLPTIGFESVFVLLPFSLLLSFLTLGYSKVTLRISRNQKTSLADMFNETALFFRVILADLLTSIITILGCVLLIVPGIILAYSYSMTYYVMLDNPELSAWECMKESKRIMKGNKFDFFIFGLSFFWWYLLSIVTLGIAGLYTGPYISVATAKFYDSIKSENSSDVSEPEIQATEA